jgi:hypothetical protein
MIRRKRNYIKFVRGTYKNDSEANYKKLNIMVNAKNKLENNKINLKHKIK